MVIHWRDETSLAELAVLPGSVRSMILDGPELDDASLWARFSGRFTIVAIDGGDGRPTPRSTASTTLANADRVVILHDFASSSDADGYMHVVEPNRSRRAEFLAALAADAPPTANDAPPVAPSTRRLFFLQLAARKAFLTSDRIGESAYLDQLLRDRHPDAARATPRSKRECPLVLFVSHDLTRTGAPMALFRTLRAALENAPIFQSCVLGIGRGPMEDEFRTLGVPFRRADYDEGHSIHGSILREIDDLDPDLVVLNGSPLYQLAILLQWKRTNLIWWYHDGINVAARDGHMFANPSLEDMTRYALSGTSRILVPADDTIRQLALYAPKTIGHATHVPNGLDFPAIDAAARQYRTRRASIRAELDFGEHRTVFLCIGSFESRKNQVRLVQAFKKLCDETSSNVDLLLVFVGTLYPEGDGPDSYFEAVRAQSLGAHEHRIRFAGSRSDALKWMIAADCHVLVSTNECSPLVNLEALAVGTFAISSRVHGIPEVVIDGETGLLVDPVSIDDITGCMKNFLRMKNERPDEIDRIKNSGRRFVETKHHIRTSSAALTRAIDDFLCQTTENATIRGEEAAEFFGRELIRRWAILKNDANVEAHIARSFAHALFCEREQSA